jgi:glycerol kinase
VGSSKGLLTSVAWKLDDKVTYCMEGSVFVGGAVVQWMRDGLRAIAKSADIEQLAGSVPDSGGVYFVPAFVGLGAPYWNPYARGTIIGLTRDTKVEHIARAALEAIAYQSRDVLDLMQLEAGLKLPSLRVDGGATANSALLQFQADVLGIPVLRPKVLETTALGAAYLAGLAVGYWKNADDIAANWTLDREFKPRVEPEKRDAQYRQWRRAVERSLDWEEH